MRLNRNKLFKNKVYRRNRKIQLKEMRRFLSKQDYKKEMKRQRKERKEMSKESWQLKFYVRFEKITPAEIIENGVIGVIKHDAKSK